jgi:hypothetical protein
MNEEQFRAAGKWLIDFIIAYNHSVKNLDVSPSVQPGFLRRYISCKLKVILFFKI